MSDTKMHGYLIDPFTKSITTVEWDGDYQSIYRLIDCDTFTVVTVNAKRDSVFVDDEGLINGKPQEFFLFDGYPQPLAGKGLVLGCDSVGESVTPTMTEEQVRARVIWAKPVTVEGFLMAWTGEAA